ncbi:hypothetical protein JDF658_17340 [Carboxydocella sp. JDF658]|nr:hypothetical protein JDF658_17340 [Carboxydocella sp. JDF658]
MEMQVLPVLAYIFLPFLANLRGICQQRENISDYKKCKWGDILVDREILSQHSRWVGFVGIMTVIFGVISAIAGLFAFIVGAIPGIITIILGLKLRGAKKYADQIIASGGDSTQLNMLFMNLNTYFKIQGVLIIINLIMIALAIFFGIFAGVASMNMMSPNSF